MRVLVISESGCGYAQEVAAALRANGVAAIELRVGFEQAGGLFRLVTEASDDVLDLRVKGRLGFLLRHRDRPMGRLIQRLIHRHLGGLAGFSHVLVFGAVPLGAAIGRLCHQAQLPMLLFPAAMELLSEPRSKRLLSLRSEAMRLSHAVVVGSEILLNALPTNVKGQVLPPPLPDGVFRFRPMPMGSSLYVVMAWNWTEEHPVVARPKLAIRALVEAESELGRPLILGIIGGGERLPELKDYVKGAGLHASFFGELDDVGMARELQRADLFLHPADFALHPRAMLAALRCGVPVLASDVEGMSALLGGEDNGMLVPNRLSAWKEALLLAVTTEFDRGGIAAANSGRFSQTEWTRKLLAVLPER